jgi:hypothetical protein
LLHAIVPDTIEIVKELGGSRQNTLRRVRGAFFGQRGYLFADIRVARGFLEIGRIVRD